jgi:hypothetical protein
MEPQINVLILKHPTCPDFIHVVSASSEPNISSAQYGILTPMPTGNENATIRQLYCRVIDAKPLYFWGSLPC